MFFSHFSKKFLEKGLFRQFQRFALVALGRAAGRRPNRKNYQRKKLLENGDRVPSVHCTLWWAVFDLKTHLRFTLLTNNSQLVPSLAISYRLIPSTQNLHHLRG